MQEEFLVDDIDMLEGLKQYIHLCLILQETQDYAAEKEKDFIFTARENARRQTRLQEKALAAMELI